MHVPIPHLGHVTMQKNSKNVKVIVYRLKKSMRIEKGSGVFRRGEHCAKGCQLKEKGMWY